jgi:hypothetical protein
MPYTVSANARTNWRYPSQNSGVSPTSSANFGCNPQFSSVSIIPGMLTAAPLRTDTSSGRAVRPNSRPVFSSSLAKCSRTCSSNPSGHRPPSSK